MRARGLHLAITLRRLRPARGLAVALSVAALVSMVGGQIHSLSVTHVRCATHGELEHVERSGEAGGATEGVAVEEASPTAAPGHDHCALATVLGRSLSYGRTLHAVALSAPPAVSPRPPSTVAPRPLRPRATVLLAPKTSPPSV